MKEFLSGIGLTNSEIEVYLALISMGTSPAGKLAGHVKLYRKNTYDALARLMEKGLVTSVIEGKIRYFQAKNPDNLSNYMDEMAEKISEQKSSLGPVIAQLKRQYNNASPEIEAEIYRGNDGIKTILNECLECDEVRFIGATGDVETRLQYFWPKYNEKRMEKKVLWKLLLVHEARNKKITESKYYEYRMLPKELSGPNVIYIFGDAVANVLWLEKPLAFVVRHKHLADSYRRYFHYLWRVVEKTDI